MAKRLRVGILFGGRSAEHEISIRSAANVMAAADPKKYEVVPIAITKDGRWYVGMLPGGSTSRPRLDAARGKSLEVVPAAGPAGPGPLVPVRKSKSNTRFGRLDIIFPILHGTFGEDGTVQGLLELAGILTLARACLAPQRVWTRKS